DVLREIFQFSKISGIRYRPSQSRDRFIEPGIVFSLDIFSRNFFQPLLTTGRERHVACVGSRIESEGVQSFFGMSLLERFPCGSRVGLDSAAQFLIVRI